MMSLVWLLHLLILIVIVVLLWWRWKMVNQPWLSDERCEELSWLVIENLFENGARSRRACPISS